MSTEVARFLPVAGLLVGLIVGFAFDPTAERVAGWWCPACLLAGFEARYAMLRYANARR